MAYTQTQWQTGDPITQARMMKIEDGIAAAQSTADGALKPTDSRFTTVESDLSTLQTVVGSDDSQGLRRQIIDLNTTIQQAAGNDSPGAKSWTQIVAATTNNETAYDNLDARFTAIETEVNAESTQRKANTTQITNAMRNSSDSLVQRFLDVESGVSSLSGAMNSIDDTLTGAGLGHGSLGQRLTDIDGNTVPTRTLPNVIAEIDAAHGANNVHGTLDNRFSTIETELTNAHSSAALAENGVNKSYASIDARFEAIEGELVGATNMSSRLDTIDSNVSELANNKVNKTDIANNLTTATAGKVLDASQGKILKDSIDAMDEAYKAADTTINGAINTINNNISAMDTAYKAADTALQTSITNMDTAYKAADTALGQRIDNLASSTSGVTDGLDTRLSTAEGKITTLESTVNNETTGLAATKAIADAAKAKADTALQPADITSLSNDVDALKDKDTIVIDYDGQHSNYTNDVPNIATANIKSNADYLIADDDGKYFYWRYINSAWKLISSAGTGGGTGSSSGEFAATLASITNPDENTDYFVGDNTIGYTHYRYVPGQNNNQGQFVMILPKNLINNLSVDNYGGLVAHSIGDDQTNLLADFYALKDVTYTPNYDPNDANTLVSQTLQFTRTDGQQLDPIVIIGGGGGGGSVYTVRIETTTDLARSIPANSTDPVTIRAKVVMKQGTELVPGATATGQIQYRVYGASTWNTGDRIEVPAVEESLKYTIQNDTYFTVDVSKYLQVDKTVQIRLVIAAHPESEEVDVMRYQTYTVSKVNISIADESFDYASVKNSNFQFNYRCFGSGISKTVHFLLDGTDVVDPVTTTSHNTVLQQVIPMTGKANGMHTFQVYFVTNTGLQSNILNYYILYNTDTNRKAPLIGAAAENASITDGDELVVNYSVTTVGSETTDRVEIELYTMDNGTKNSIQTDVLTDVTNNVLADPPYSTFNYPKVVKTGEEDPDPITVYVTLTAYHGELSDSQTVQVTVGYLNTSYNLDAEGENNLVFTYNAYGHSNNEANKQTYNYTFTNVSGNSVNFTGTLSNFNWATDGYVDGKCLTIGGGATMNINVPIFSNSVNGISLEENADSSGVLDQDITKNGRTIEIDYEVLSATDLNAVIMNCMSNISTTTENSVTVTRANGFQVTPQSCYLLNSSTGIERDDSGFILNEDSVAAAYLTPGQRIHLVFVIEPWATDAMRDASFDGEYHQSTNIYVNGEFANTCPYNRDKNTGNLAGNNFSTNATITIGDDSCLIKLYSIKLYNRGLTQEQVLQNYKVSPVATREKLVRLEENDVLNAAGLVDYEKARTKYTCLLLTGPAPLDANNAVVPTISPFKGSPSPAGRRDKKTNELVGKTESGLTLTKPSKTSSTGYTIEFDLQDKIPTDQTVEVPAYMGARGAYCSSNNVQGTSSQKYPLHNLKVYLAKWQAPKTTTTNVPLEENEEVPEGTETVEIDGVTYKVVTTTTPAEIKKVKYCLKGKDDNGDPLGTEESTFCWKADYMSTDHANTFNANVADGLFNNRAEDGWPITNWAAKHYQNTVYGIRCLLFQKQGDNPPVFVGDGCLNNDKGNSKTYGLEADGDDGNDTRSQKWELTNNSEDLGYFKTDDLTAPMGDSIRAKNGFESTYPDEGDLTDDGLEPNYNHLQILLTWLSKRANYWDEADPTARATKKAIFRNEFTKHFNLNHVLTYYIFSQYIALCDNRVKNMFLRSDNIREEVIKNTSGNVILNGNNEPDALWSNYVDPSTGATTPSYIDWETGEGHSNFAIWEPVLYDLDSCFGVENVGLIKIRYDADWDYEWKGTPQFNGYNSILWLQVEDTFQSEIATLATSLYNQNPGLNFRTFNQQQIIENQAQISPAITNQDMILKFDKPWSEGFINYAETPDGNGNYPKQTPLYKYLQRGSRAAQKSQFMQQRSMLLSSMYGADEFKNSSIKFRTGVPVGASGNIIGYDDNENPIYGNGDLTETQITVKANQILYPGVAYGDNKPATRVLTNNGKVGADTACTIQATSAVQGNDGIFIYGASVLTDIGDISKFKPLQLDVSAGVNLKRLIIGSDATGYVNNTTNSITGLNKCVLLEEINVRNLKQMSTLTLTSNGFIKDVYAAGSGVGTISLPQGGVLETIEYGENTTDITIVNQGRLTNFSYENSTTNNYSNVTRLWIENTPNVPIKDIITARLTPLASSDAGLRAGGLRIIGLDLNLGSDSAFLQLLVSDLAKGTYLSSRGSHTEGNTDYPTITGSVRITQIRRSLYNKLHEIYPDLVVTANRIDEEYEVKYYNYDGETLLFTDHGTNEDYVKDPAYDIDPITNAPYISIPEKPADAQYIYRFGLYNNQNKYRRFTGWVKIGTSINPTSSDTINGDLTFIATYPTREDQYYTVSWYQEADGNLQTTRTVKYGTDLSSEQSPVETGAMMRVRTGGNSVKVFKGWSSPLGKITHDTDVYGLWEESTINDTTENIVMENLTAADIYAIARLNNARKAEVLTSKLGSHIMVPMGQQYDYPEGVNITNLLGNDDIIELDGSTDMIHIYDGQGGRSNIRPLSVNSDWTLALDYKFLMDSESSFFNGEYVLASCYQNANSSIVGFKVSLIRNSSSSNHAIQVSWGTNTLTIDYATVDTTSSWTFQSYRNVVVLSHNSDDPNKLRVSYRVPNTSGTAPYGANYSTTLVNTNLTWESNANISTPLIIGGNYRGATTTIEDNSTTRCPAQGVIYWAKYWDTDLGEINCSNIAAWTHETIPFVLTGYNGASLRSTEQIYTASSLSFSAAQGIGDRYFYAGAGTNDSNGIFGWHQSNMRAICNNLIYTGFPETYKAIIALQEVESLKRYCGEGTQYNTFEPNTEDHLFLVARREIDDTMTPGSNEESREVNTSWIGPWNWFANARTVLQLWSTSSNVVEETSAMSDNYYLYRFNNGFISEDSRIFRLSNRPTTINNLTLRTSSGNQPITMRSGDVWVNDDGVAYIYRSETDIAHGDMVDIRESSGGWKQATEWALRTYNTSATSPQEWHFMRVTAQGTIITSPTSSSRNTPRLICPEFTVRV